MIAALQALALTLVLLAAVGVVVLHDPRRQVFAAGVFGLLLVSLFVLLQAPDVGLSELVITTVPTPLLILVAVYRTRDDRTKK